MASIRIISKDDGREILLKLQHEVGRSEEVEGLAAATQGTDTEILERERDLGELCGGASPFHIYTTRRQG